MTELSFALLYFMPQVLEMASLLHVTLLVFLRLLAVKTPMAYHISHTNVPYSSLITIWATCILLQSLPLLALSFNKYSVYTYLRLLNLHCFHTIPLLLILLMYTSLIWTLRRKEKQQRQDFQNLPFNSMDYRETRNKKMTLLVKRVVIFLLISYAPFVAWYQYYYIVVCKRDPLQILAVEVTIFYSNNILFH